MERIIITSSIILFFIVLIYVYTSRRRRRKFFIKNICEAADYLMPLVEQRYLVQPCPRCHEFVMRLLEISPNARSVYYECIYCDKKMRAPASAPNADHALEIFTGIQEMLEQYGTIPNSPPFEPELTFETPPAPLPYEKTSRKPLPEAVRSEVWRRDGGCCVLCGSRENLQFDHIIPVAQGGSTTAANLQLLCQRCNRAKGARI